MKGITYISSKQMAEVDRLAMKSGIKLYQMMEREATEMSKFIINLKPKPKRVLVLFGKGNNGAGGLTAGRYLKAKGIDVYIVGAERKGNNKVVKHHLEILRIAGTKQKKDFPSLKKNDVVIDALLGYNLKGVPRGSYASLIKKVNALKKKGIKIVSLDLPSGLNPDSGEVNGECVEANYTLTLALPKTGLKEKSAKKFIGKLFLVDIGIPYKVYKKLGINIGDYFKGKYIISL